MNKLGSYITKLMTTILDSEQEEFVRELALSELKRLNVDVNEFINKHTKDNFDKAKERTNNFKGLNHLSEKYFSDVANVLTFESYFSNLFVKYYQGTFSETTKNFNKEIDILHLDCDLYQSYLDVLNNLYKNVKQGGSIIFDEYYSLKYPGARIAVNEFFSNQSVDRFEKYITQDSFERWCVVK